MGTIYNGFISWVNQNYEEMIRDKEVLHDKVLQKRILTTWKQKSPRMWSEILNHPGLAERLAYVLQEKMRRERACLIAMGYSPNNAEKEAERRWLMLEPEENIKATNNLH